MLHFFDPARGARSLTRDDPTGFAAPPAFGPFRVLHQIGVGALGPVFRTYEPTRDRLVAVKVFRLDVTPEQAVALADELGRATEGSLFHPSIVEPVSAGVEGTVAYRAEEYVAAESLDVAMRHYAPATLDKALPFITQLASAIDFARQAGVGHGALHPRDIFVTPDEARATGFGVVDALDRLGLRAPVRRPYSPPERIAGERWGTPADVFSLAAIAFELLTGRRPLGLGDQIGPLTGANVGEYGEAIRAVLVRAMREHPVERFTTAMEFASELARVSGQVPVATEAAPVAKKVAEPRPAPPAEVPAVSDIVAAVPVPNEQEKEQAKEEDQKDEKAEEAEQDSLGHILALDDSPREVARKVIAARKRQGQSKAKSPARQELDAAVSLLVPPDPVPEALPALPEATATIETVEPTAQFAPEGPVEELSALEPPDDPSTLDAAIMAMDEPPEVQFNKDEPSLDELRPREREIDAFRAERPWPRPAERADPLTFEPASFWSPEPKTPSRGVEASSARVPDLPIDRAVVPKPTALEPFDPELPPPLPLRPTAPPPPEPLQVIADDPAAVERPRTMMLPTAIGLILGLLLGYLAGYSVGSRDVTKQLAQATANDATPVQGAGPTPGAAATDARVNPPAADQKPVEPPPPVPSDARGATPPATSAAPPSSTKPPATAQPAVKPPVVAPPADKPAATPPAAARETTKPVPTTTAGRIVVSSTPSRAAVTVNGVWSGRTPLTLAERPFGKYVVRVVEPGYAVERQEFVLSSNAPSKTIDVTLERSGAARGEKPAASKSPSSAPPQPVESKPTSTAGRGQTPATPGATTGAIFVDSRPQGARVLVDGRDYGVTPTTVPGLTLGQHTIRLELADHAPWTKTETVTGGTTVRVTGSLEPIR